MYSFGLGDEIEFETRLIEKYGCEVWGYDPMPESERYITSNFNLKKFHYMRAALTAHDGVEKCYLPQNKDFISGSLRKENVNWQKLSDDFIFTNCYSLKTLMKMNNHSSIDYLKLCVEGAEFEVVKNVLDEKLDIKQIAISFCGRGMKKNYSLEKNLYKNLLASGYECLPYRYDGHISFLKSRNNQSF